VANGLAPVIPQSTEGSSFEPSVRKKVLQKVGCYSLYNFIEFNVMLNIWF